MRDGLTQLHATPPNAPPDAEMAEKLALLLSAIRSDIDIAALVDVLHTDENTTEITC